MARKTTAARDTSTASGIAARSARSTSNRRPNRTMAPAAEAVEFLEPVAQPAPTHEEIAELAYSYWEARGCQGGSAAEDWTRAERELARRAIAATA